MVEGNERNFDFVSLLNAIGLIDSDGDDDYIIDSTGNPFNPMTAIHNFISQRHFDDRKVEDIVSPQERQEVSYPFQFPTRELMRKQRERLAAVAVPREHNKLRRRAIAPKSTPLTSRVAPEVEDESMVAPSTTVETSEVVSPVDAPVGDQVGEPTVENQEEGNVRQEKAAGEEVCAASLGWDEWMVNSHNSDLVFPPYPQMKMQMVEELESVAEQRQGFLASLEVLEKVNRLLNRSKDRLTEVGQEVPLSEAVQEILTFGADREIPTSEAAQEVPTFEAAQEVPTSEVAREGRGRASQIGDVTPQSSPPSVSPSSTDPCDRCS